MWFTGVNMADDTSNFSGITVDSRARKYYEGWAYHSPLNGRVCMTKITFEKIYLCDLLRYLWSMRD